METKKAWQSRTIVLNAIMGLIGAVALFVPQAKVVGDFLTSHSEAVIMVWSLMNVVLRAVTSGKISLTD